MEKTTLIWLISSFTIILSHDDPPPTEYNGFCVNMFIHGKHLLSKLENCTVVVGDLKISPAERTTAEDFKNVTFPKLKEVTGYMAIYRVFGLESLGNLFPNLIRIRGNTLLYNYALILYDMAGLREVGLYSLLKIDRGGVIIWGNPLTCFVDTIDWNAISPNSRHVLRTPDREARCNFPCTCSDVKSRNRCWNNRKCQRFLEGPESVNCSSECFGCRITKHNSCSLCRNYTFRGECVARCPDDTYLLTASNYCLTEDECLHINHWVWNKKCVSECPNNYINATKDGHVTCVPCQNCSLKCKSLVIQAISAIQNAKKCVYVEGFLKIHIWSIPKVLDELNFYLQNIVEVSEYILIYGSIQITSLHFLSSLKRIKGKELYDGRYSLVIYDMHNLQDLFLPNVTQNLKVDRGSMSMYRNRMLCMSQIEKVRPVFPVIPSETDVPPELNGYSAGCDEVYSNLKIQVWNETFATAIFEPLSKDDVQYALLYVKIPYGSHSSIIPESCSDSEWHAVNVPKTSGNTVEVELPFLNPATSYAICIEKYDPKTRHLARSNITNFTTAIGIPEPPFILELVASSYNLVVIRWVNHLDYRPYIIKYEIDIFLVDINDNDVIVRDHCASIDDDTFEIDYSRHAKVMKPPNNYEQGCESKCGILSLVTKGAMVEEYFDICNTINGCHSKSERPKNLTSQGFIKSLALDIKGQRNDYQVGGLLPFRDYKFHLRGCTESLCSSTATGVVRTLRLDSADIASISFASANTLGYVSVKWDPPTKTNGPVLSYTLEIYSDTQIYDINHSVPQLWCVLSNTTSITVKSNIAEKYLIRICSTTLGNAYICNGWMKILAHTEQKSSFGWIGIIFGILLPIFSCILGWKLKFKNKEDPQQALVDAVWTYRQETEPPATMFSDFMQGDLTSG